MNKKISTLLTAGLLMAGALFGKAMATNDAIEALSGNVKEFPGYYVLGTGADGFLKGEKKTIGDTDFTIFAGTSETDLSDATAIEDAYLWTIEPQVVNGTQVTGFKFKNKETGGYLTLQDDATTQPSAYTTKPTVNVLTWITSVSANGFSMTATALKTGTTNGVKFATGTVTMDGTPVAMSAYKVIDAEINAAGLNATRGSFSFNAAGLDDNFFNKNVKAFDVTKITTGFATVNPNQEIPAGLYLATAWGDVEAITGYDDFAKCTFIVIDPNTSVGKVPATDIKDGKNLSFKTVKGSDFNFFTDAATKDQVSKNDEVSVMNACFKVETNSTQCDADGNYSYAITTVGNIRFQPEAAKAAQKTSTKPAGINVVEVDKDVKKLTATVGGDKGYVFKFGSNPISKVARLLNDKGASIYNIRFESGKVETEKGKYLAVGTASSAYVFVAQGTAVAELGSPLYQFVISAVDTKTNEVTFTNRETSEKFTCVLDTTTTSGVYKVAAVTGGTTYTLVTVGADGAYDYTTTGQVLLGKTISLIPATVDQMAGFAVRGENKDYVRLSFGKDATANMVYAKVSSSHTLDVATAKEEEAAAFELIRSEKPVLARHDYVMLDSKGDAKTVALKDTVAYYTYNLKLIENGATGIPYYLKESTGLSLEQTTTPTTDFIIKENKDGSVSIMKAVSAAATAIDLTAAGATPTFTGEPYVNADASSLKLFLTKQTYGASLPAENAHIALEAATVLNSFIGMNANRDAVLVSKTAADEAVTLYLDTVDVNATLPSFYISQGVKATKAASGERLYMYNAADSATYVGGPDAQNPYLWTTGVTKVIFKAATVVNSDTLTTMVKGKATNVASEASTDGTVAGLDNFRFQIYKANDSEDAYVVRSNGEYLQNVNGKLTLNSDLSKALKVFVDAQETPTSNDAVTVTAIKVVAGEGQLTIAGAAGKKVVVSNILGQVIANTVVASDNATIAAPAGVVVVAVEGEAAVKAIVK